MLLDGSDNHDKLQILLRLIANFNLHATLAIYRGTRGTPAMKLIQKVEYGFVNLINLIKLVVSKKFLVYINFLCSNEYFMAFKGGKYSHGFTRCY